MNEYISVMSKRYTVSPSQTIDVVIVSDVISGKAVLFYPEGVPSETLHIIQQKTPDSSKYTFVEVPNEGVNWTPTGNDGMRALLSEEINGVCGCAGLMAKYIHWIYR